MARFKRFLKLQNDPTPVVFTDRPMLQATRFTVNSVTYIAVDDAAYAILNLRKNSKAVFTLVKQSTYMQVVGWRLVK